MNYRSIEDLNRYIVLGLKKVPADTDLIVGVPRSGLLAANILALHLNLPCAEVNGFMKGEILYTGARLKKYLKPFSEYKRILVVEDSVWSGSSIKEVKEKFAGLYPDKEIRYAAVFVDPGAIDKVDIYFDICKGPRIFEWNLMHHDMLENSCFDIDGVLCQDPTEEENDDGTRYEHFLANVEPLYKPSKTIGYLVTNRLEKYRPFTEAWLAKHNVKYKHLIMLDLPSKEARLKANNHGGFKASVYMKYDCNLFIESSIWQSHQIANISGKAVYCMDERRMIYPNTLVPSNGQIRQLVKKTLRKVKGSLANIW